MNRIMIYAAAIAVVSVIASCGLPPQDVTRILEGQGLSNVQVGGPSPWGCSKGDSFSATFTALGPTGKPVQGVVCKGTFKGYTVRFD